MEPLRRTHVARLAAAVVFLALAAAACSNRGTTSPSSAAPATPTSFDRAAKLGPVAAAPATFGRYAVPLPAGAARDKRDTGDGVGSTTSFYFPHMTGDQLRGFYDSHMPNGHAWRGLDWCEAAPVPDLHTVWRTWKRPAAEDYLIVSVFDAEASGAPAAVQVFDDPDDPSGQPCAG